MDTLGSMSQLDPAPRDWWSENIPELSQGGSNTGVNGDGDPGLGDWLRRERELNGRTQAPITFPGGTIPAIGGPGDPNARITQPGGPLSGLTGSQDFRGWFESAIQGKPPGIETLLAMQAEIEAHGGKLIPNATMGPDGKPTNYDVYFPGEGIVDVLQNATNSGQKAWQHLTGNGGGSGGQFGTGSLAQGYGKEFAGPTLDEFRNSPGYQFAREEGLKGVERSAASHGDLLTGGTLKRLAQYGTGLADQTFGDAFSRSGQTFDRNYNVWRNSSNDIFGRYFNLAQLGAGSAQGAAS